MALVLFDQGTPVPLRKELGSHRVETARERKWSTLENGDLLSAAEGAGFDVLVTTDQNLRYQQNLGKRRISIVVLGTTSWPRIQRVAFRVREAVDAARVGSYAEVPID